MLYTCTRMCTWTAQVPAREKEPCAQESFSLFLGMGKGRPVNAPHSRYRPAAGFEVHASYRPLKSFCSTPLHTSCLQDIWSLKLPLPNEELTKWRAQDARPKSGEPPRYSLQRAVARSGSCGSAALTEQACPPEIALPHRCCPSTASPIHRCSHSAVLFDSLVLIS